MVYRNGLTSRLLVWPVLLLTLLAGAIVVPVLKAQGETATPTPTGAATALPTVNSLSITGVQPTSVVNDLDVEIIVTGRGFINGAVIVLADFGGLSTTYVSESVLRATVPAGTSPGTHRVRVVNPDAAAAELAQALTVVSPAEPTGTPEASRTPEPTAFARPLLVVQSYGASAALITPGQNLDFEMTLTNAGQTTATNILASFASGHFVPRDTGGVRALGSLAPGESVRFWQPLFASADLRGATTAVLEVTVSYTDMVGQSYEAAFDLSFPVVPVSSGGAAATATPTATPTITPTAGPRLRPQLLVTSYETDPAELEPGNTFALTITVVNEGEATARNVTMIIGGGNLNTDTSSGTPEAGGVSGASGEFSHFAPIGSSNISRLGDLNIGQSKLATQRLVVNTTTEPGAYPMKVSFTYTDSAGIYFVDDQVITLLVVLEPQVEMGFYTAPQPFLVGQPGGLPLQLVNTGRDLAIFGNFTVRATGGELSNSSVFVGALESGGFFPLDAVLTPFEPGPLDLELSVRYTDDFNQPATLTQTVTIDVLEEEMVGPPSDAPFGEEASGDGEVVDGAATETVVQRILRFLRGLFGFGSAAP